MPHPPQPRGLGGDPVVDASHDYYDAIANFSVRTMLGPLPGMPTASGGVPEPKIWQYTGAEAVTEPRWDASAASSAGRNKDMPSPSPMESAIDLGPCLGEMYGLDEAICLGKRGRGTCFWNNAIADGILRQLRGIGVVYKIMHTL